MVQFAQAKPNAGFIRFSQRLDPRWKYIFVKQKVENRREKKKLFNMRDCTCPNYGTLLAAGNSRYSICHVTDNLTSVAKPTAHLPVSDYHNWVSFVSSRRQRLQLGWKTVGGGVKIFQSNSAAGVGVAFLTSTFSWKS